MEYVVILLVLAILAGAVWYAVFRKSPEEAGVDNAFGKLVDAVKKEADINNDGKVNAADAKEAVKKAVVKVEEAAVKVEEKAQEVAKKVKKTVKEKVKKAK